MVSFVALLCLHLCPLSCPAQMPDDPARPVSISGIILDPDGQPVRDGHVTIWWGWWSNPRSVGRITQWGGGELRTGPAGEFALHGVPPGSVQLSLRIPNMLPVYSHGPVTVQRGKPTADVVLRSPGYGGSVTGTVSDESGHPVADALVTASSLASARGSARILKDLEEAGETARTGPEGRFKLVNVHPGKRTIWAFGGRWAPATSRVEVAEGAHCPTTLTLSRCLPGTWTIAARVVDSNGRPVPGAAMSVDYTMEAGERSSLPRQFTTTDQGECLVYGLPPSRPVYIRVHHPAFGMWQGEVQGTEGEYRTTTIRVPRGAKIRGVMRFSDGTPLVDREIDVSLSGPALDRSHWADLRFRLTTDEHGSYLICGLQPGEWHLQAEIDRGQRATREELQIKQWYTRHDIVFGHAGAASGRVVGPDGKLVPDAWLQFRQQESGSYELRWTDDGYFRCEDMDPGQYTAVAWARGFWPSMTDVELPAVQRAAALRLRLGDGPTVSGTVVDAAGQPLSGIAIHMVPQAIAWSDLAPPMQWDSRGLWSQRLAPLYTMLGCMDPDGVAATGADGTFAIRGVSANTIGLLATGAGYRPSGAQSGFWRRIAEGVVPVEVNERHADGTYIAAGGALIGLPDGKDVTGVVIRVAKAVPDEGLCQVRGTVRDPHGQFADLAGLTVAVSESPTGLRQDIGPGYPLDPTGHDRTGVGDDGTFEIRNVPPGERTVLVGDEDGTCQLAQLDLQPGQTADLGELSVPMAGPVEGTVSDADGQPVAEGVVLASRREDRLSFSSATSKHWKEQRTVIEADGTYSFGELGPGFWHLMAVCPSWTSAGIKRVFVNGDRQHVDFAHGYSGRITGRTLDTDGGPVAGARINCQGRTLKSSVDAKTDEDGRFMIAGLPSGSYALTASHQWCLPVPASGVEVDEQAPAVSVEFVFERGGTIQARLLGADGQPVRGAEGTWEVRVGPPWTEEPAGYLMRDGTIRSKVLKPGTYVLRVRPKNAAEDAPWTESEPIGVYAGKPSIGAVIELPSR